MNPAAKFLILPFLVSSVIAGPISSTLLVNFTGMNPEPVADVSASDFAVGDPNVMLDAPVHTKHPKKALNVSGGGLHEVTVTSPITGSWNATRGMYPDTPILDSYIYTKKPGDLIVTIRGFDEIGDGQNVTLTVWGVGDQEGQDSKIVISYDGPMSAPQETNYDSFPEAYKSFTFIKKDGVDEVTIHWTCRNCPKPGPISGFSMTTKP